MNVGLDLVEKALSVLDEALMALDAFTPKDHAEDYQYDWAKHTFWTAKGFVTLKERWPASCGPAYDPTRN